MGLIGNSLGWYTATHLAGCLPFGDCLEIVLRTGGWQRQNSVGSQVRVKVRARARVRARVRVSTPNRKPNPNPSPDLSQLVYPSLTEEWLRSDALQADIDEALRRANQVGYASLQPNPSPHPNPNPNPKPHPNAYPLP